MQPVVQVVASFPAPMIFPIVILALKSAHVSLGWGSILLMLLGGAKRISNSRSRGIQPRKRS